MKKSNKKGFTIVELVIVIAVIAILAAVMIPTFSGVIEKANENAALQEVSNAYKVYMADEMLKGNTPEPKIVVEYDGITIVIENGAAKVADDDFTADDAWTEMEVGTIGPDKGLVMVAEDVAAE